MGGLRLNRDYYERMIIQDSQTGRLIDMGPPTHSSVLKSLLGLVPMDGPGVVPTQWVGTASDGSATCMSFRTQVADPTRVRLQAAVYLGSCW